MTTETMKTTTPYLAAANVVLGPVNIIIGILTGWPVYILIGLFVTAMGVGYFITNRNGS